MRGIKPYLRKRSTILGEAVNRFSDVYITANPQIPIAAIRGMRNRIIHEYKEIDLQILWEVIPTNIPEAIAWAFWTSFLG